MARQSREVMAPTLRVARQGKNRVTIEARLFFKVVKEGKLFVSTCDQLQVASQGYSRKEALDNLHEAVELFFLTCIERGTLERALEELRWICIDSSRGEQDCKSSFPKDIPQTPPAFVIDSLNKAGTDVSLKMRW
ncbi:MAG: hypothetical protein JXR96_04460 [Deltaproteobacteria bacterium]|nr:hypothetical protein [Deltaproteobacteria bacterium]